MTVVVAVGAALAQLLLVADWLRSVQVGASRGGQVVLVGAAAAADAGVLLADDAHPTAPVAPVLAVALLAAFVVQLVRRDGRERLTASLTATGTGAALVVLGSLWLALDRVRHGDPVLVVAAVAVAATVLADLLPVPPPARAGAGAVATLVAALVVAAASDLGAGTALATGACCAVAAWLAVLAGRRVPEPRPLLPTALAALLVAPAGYLLARLLVG